MSIVLFLQITSDLYPRYRLCITRHIVKTSDSRLWLWVPRNFMEVGFAIFYPTASDFKHPASEPLHIPVLDATRFCSSYFPFDGQILSFLAMIRIYKRTIDLIYISDSQILHFYTFLQVQYKGPISCKVQWK
jgi:hypothetical protein